VTARSEVLASIIDKEGQIREGRATILQKGWTVFIGSGIIVVFELPKKRSAFVTQLEPDHAKHPNVNRLELVIENGGPKVLYLTRAGELLFAIPSGNNKYRKIGYLPLTGPERATTLRRIGESSILVAATSTGNLFSIIMVKGRPLIKEMKRGGWSLLGTASRFLSVQNSRPAIVCLDHSDFSNRVTCDLAAISSDSIQIWNIDFKSRELSFKSEYELSMLKDKIRKANKMQNLQNVQILRVHYGNELVILIMGSTTGYVHYFLALVELTKEGINCKTTREILKISRYDQIISDTTNVELKVLERGDSIVLGIMSPLWFMIYEENGDGFEKKIYSKASDGEVILGGGFTSLKGKSAFAVLTTSKRKNVKLFSIGKGGELVSLRESKRKTIQTSRKSVQQPLPEIKRIRSNEVKLAFSSDKDIQVQSRKIINQMPGQSEPYSYDSSLVRRIITQKLSNYHVFLEGLDVEYSQGNATRIWSRLSPATQYLVADNLEILGAAIEFKMNLNSKEVKVDYKRFVFNAMKQTIEDIVEDKGWKVPEELTIPEYFFSYVYCLKPFFQTINKFMRKLLQGSISSDSEKLKQTLICFRVIHRITKSANSYRRLFQKSNLKLPRDSAERWTFKYCRTLFRSIIDLSTSLMRSRNLSREEKKELSQLVLIMGKILLAEYLDQLGRSNDKKVCQEEFVQIREWVMTSEIQQENEIIALAKKFHHYKTLLSYCERLPTPERRDQKLIAYASDFSRRGSLLEGEDYFQTVLQFHQKSMRRILEISRLRGYEPLKRLIKKEDLGGKAIHFPWLDALGRGQLSDGAKKLCGTALQTKDIRNRKHLLSLCKLSLLAAGRNTDVPFVDAHLELIRAHEMLRKSRLHKEGEIIGLLLEFDEKKGKDQKMYQSHIRTALKVCNAFFLKKRKETQMLEEMWESMCKISEEDLVRFERQRSSNIADLSLDENSPISQFVEAAHSINFPKNLLVRCVEVSPNSPSQKQILRNLISAIYDSSPPRQSLMVVDDFKIA